jgi:hypothetical protein
MRIALLTRTCASSPPRSARRPSPCSPQSFRHLPTLSRSARPRTARKRRGGANTGAASSRSPRASCAVLWGSIGARRVTRVAKPARSGGVGTVLASRDSEGLPNSAEPSQPAGAVPKLRVAGSNPVSRSNFPLTFCRFPSTSAGEVCRPRRRRGAPVGHEAPTTRRVASRARRRGGELERVRVDRGAQVLDDQVPVGFGRHPHVAVPHQPLDAVHVDAGAEQGGGEGVPEVVEAHRDVQRHRPEPAPAGLASGGLGRRWSSGTSGRSAARRRRPAPCARTSGIGARTRGRCRRAPGRDAGSSAGSASRDRCEPSGEGKSRGPARALAGTRARGGAARG